MVVLELEGESFRQNGIGKHIQKTLDRLFEGYVSAYFRFGLDYKLKVRALNYTNPKVLPDQPNDYAIFQATFDLRPASGPRRAQKKPMSTMRFKLHTRTNPPST